VDIKQKEVSDANSNIHLFRLFQ